MTILAVVLLTVLAFAIVTYPFLRRRAARVSFGESKELKDLHYKRDHTYAMLKELENDFRSGTLSEEDYKKLEARYKSKAVSILKEMDDMREKELPDENLEVDIEKQAKGLQRKEGRFCPQCGAKQPPKARFCTECGTRL